ncbi:unnamed protein product [Toxocara canis]|uniref:DDE_Tnp_IS1595 domain-containing protein n=1 Tax=Toxocara canis TaxID=6265 RepID=A0A183VC83_TOXCA|nr:unnamed protein product [Toxocara canis]
MVFWCGEQFKCFLVPVERRNAGTLLPTTQKYVAPGTMIISDLLAAYSGVPTPLYGYQHLTVDHSINLVDPSTAATSSIESPWQMFQAEHKKRYGTQRTV